MLLFLLFFLLFSNSRGQQTFQGESPCIMCVQYIGGCSVHRWDTMSTLGGVQYIGGYHENIGGYYEYIGDTMSTSGGGGGGDIMMHVGEQVGKNLSISIENPDVLNIPRSTHDIPQCTHGIPRCTEHPLMYSWYPPDVLKIP